MDLLLKLTNKTKSSRRQIDILGVRNDVLILSNYRYRLVLEVSAINFELMSESEQDSIIEIYESFLNSIGHPLQFLVRTREIDMDSYLAGLRELFHKEHELIFQNQLTYYENFIKQLIASKKILTRRFYIVIPNDPNILKTDSAAAFERLHLNADIICKGLARLGMQSRILPGLEVLELFYSFYNPRLSKAQPLRPQTLKLIHNALVTKDKI